jgi:hypothetical protein
VQEGREEKQKESKETLPDDLGEEPKQRPAITKFGIVGNKIGIIAEPNLPIDRATAEDLYEEVKEKALAFKERSARAQFDEPLRRNVDRLLERLGANYSEAVKRPGRILPALRSLEADVRVFDTEEGRKETALDALSMLVDLAASTRDFVAAFSTLKEIEAESLAFELTANKETLDANEAEAKRIEEIVVQSEHVTDEAKAALQEHNASMKNARSQADRAKQLAYKKLDIRNFISAVTKPLWDAAKQQGAKITNSKIVKNSIGKIGAGVPTAVSTGVGTVTVVAIVYPIVSHIVDPFTAAGLTTIVLRDYLKQASVLLKHVKPEVEAKNPRKASKKSKSEEKE